MDPFGWPEPKYPPINWKLIPWWRSFTYGQQRKIEFLHKKWYEYDQVTRSHNQSCAVTRRAKDFLKRRRGVYYVDSAEATRCTCWTARMSTEEHDKMIEDMIKRLVRRERERKIHD